MTRVNAVLATLDERMSSLEGTALRARHFDNMKRLHTLLETRVMGMAEITDSRSQTLHEMHHEHEA